jgi:hypothetical protein
LLDDSVLDTHAITASTNPLNNVATFGKNPAQIDARLRQNQLLYDENNSYRLDTKSNEDCPPTNPEADSPTVPTIDPEAAPLHQDTIVPHERESDSTHHVSRTTSLSGVIFGSSVENSGDTTPSLAAGTHAGSSIPA